MFESFPSLSVEIGYVSPASQLSSLITLREPYNSLNTVVLPKTATKNVAGSWDNGFGDLVKVKRRLVRYPVLLQTEKVDPVSGIEQPIGLSYGFCAPSLRRRSSATDCRSTSLEEGGPVQFQTQATQVSKSKDLKFRNRRPPISKSNSSPVQSGRKAALKKAALTPIASSPAPPIDTFSTHSAKSKLSTSTSRSSDVSTLWDANYGWMRSRLTTKGKMNEASSLLIHATFPTRSSVSPSRLTSKPPLDLPQPEPIPFSLIQQSRRCPDNPTTHKISQPVYLHRLLQVDLAATPGGHSIDSALSQTPPNPTTTPEHDEALALGSEGPPSKRFKTTTPSTRNQPNPPAVAEAASAPPAA
ncbi:hypothetical protein NMY22_g279 [Coprinellus aureogranulatus]|nr:hypothetical protein NMY22_g279 [Coprinellus aureogranulatus]